MMMLKRGLIVCLLFPAVLMAQDSYSTLYNKGVEEIGNKRYAEAEVLFSKAIKLKPDFAEAVFAKGTCLLMMEERDKACIEFEKASALGWKPANEYIEKYCAKGVLRPSKAKPAEK